jgi:tRNA 2-thiouridine synthesizing protein A
MSHPAETLDLTGLHCPAVVLRLSEYMKERETGSRVTVVSTDPLSAIDIPLFMQRNGLRLLSRSTEGERLIFVVEKA